MKLLRPTSILFIAFSILCSCSSDSSDPTPEPDTVAPTVDFAIAGISDSSNSQTVVVSSQIQINVDADDESGIAKVETFIDGEKVGEDTTSPYQITIDVSSYASKNNLTAKFTDYTLKITVTDTSGNETSKEQVIHIDNELPSITEVSLTEGQVIGGDTNTVTFNVSDNEGFNSVKTYLNDTILEEVTEGINEINLNTLELSDGENFLKIEATDLANNITTFEVPFIADNIGPEITLESLVAGQIVDEPIQLNPDVSDANSTIASVEFFLANDTQVVLEGDVTYSWDLDPSAFNPGSISIFIKATDGLGNESSAEFPIEILRRLITINIPEDFYNPIWARMYVFASAPDGKVVDSERIFQDSQEVILRTSSDQIFTQEYSLTFAKYTSGTYGNTAQFSTLQNLNPSNLETLNLKTEPRFENGPRDPYLFSMKGFDPDDIFNSTAYGFGYSGGLNTLNQQLVLDRRKNVTNEVNTDKIYLWLKNETLDEYTYTILDWELPSDFTLDYGLFNQEDIERRFYQTSLGIGQYRSSINIYGYFNESDFENNVFHNINNSAYGFLPSQGGAYYFNTSIYKTRYEFTMKDYHTVRNGEPLTLFNDLDWTIDYTVNSKEVNLMKTGNGHSVGKIYFHTDGPQLVNGLNISFDWNIVFDSQTTEKIILPEIPDEIQTWGFYNLYQNDNFNIGQVEIRRYNGLSTYGDYLQEVIKNNNYFYTVSSTMESKYKRGDGLEGIYFKVSDFLID